MNHIQRPIARPGGRFTDTKLRGLLSVCVALSITSALLVSPGCNLICLLGIGVACTPSGCTSDDECAEEGLSACLVDDDGNGRCVECVNDSDCGDKGVCSEDADNHCVGCLSDNDCDDGDNCTIDKCASAQCSNVEVECKGRESCDESSGECVEVECKEDGDCDDGDRCTDETCENRNCVASKIDCDDGLFCTGVESCDGDTGKCVSTGNPCDSDAREVCNEDTNECELPSGCTEDHECDDGLFCNGLERCHGDGVCQSGDDPCRDVICIDDGPFCEEDDTEAFCSCPLHCDCFFTLNQDNITGSTGDDIFNAELVFVPPEAQLDTLQTGDRGDGLAGTDTLNATFYIGDDVVTPILIDIEILNFTHFASPPTTFNAANVTGATEINSVGSNQTFTVIGLATIVNLGITNSASGIDVTFQSEATSGFADSLTLTLSECMDGPDSVVTIRTEAANGFETIVIESSGEASNTLGSLSQVTGNTLKTLVITGNQDLTLGTIPFTVETIDVLGMFGEFQLGPG